MAVRQSTHRFFIIKTLKLFFANVCVCEKKVVPLRSKMYNN